MSAGPGIAGAVRELKLLTGQGDHGGDAGDDPLRHASDALVAPHGAVVEGPDDELPSLHVDAQHLV